ncbi:aldo/keto reductase [Alteromonas sp. NFXS44]|uniref:aldo/keto reductase n=1 Tax=Alteromonas sp. NFXS44 TaxID=2818435 RepID=UPI0032DF408E
MLKCSLHDGNTLPPVGLGVWQASNREVESAVDCAFGHGYRLIDTASIYENEAGVGHALKNSGLPREAFYITTKLWNTDQMRVQQALEESLTKLHLDHVDLYLIHWPAPSQGYFVDAWKGLLAAKEQGLVKSVGVSNFQPEHIQRLQQETGITPVVNQIELHPLLSQPELVDWCQKENIAVQAWSPLAQGGAGVFNSKAVSTLSRGYGKTPAQIVLRWHLQRNVCVIPKSVTPERIRENIDIYDFSLSKQDMKAMDALNENRRLGPHPDTFVNV